MKLYEFYNKQVNDELPYDVAEDVHFHMIDDDSFYRKHYLPTMDKCDLTSNEDVIRGHIIPMIDKCLNHYCLKYDLNQNPKELLSDEDKSKLVARIIEFEKNPPEDLDNAFKKPV